jgi:hypothetical protein
MPFGLLISALGAAPGGGLNPAAALCGHESYACFQCNYFVGPYRCAGIYASEPLMLEKMFLTDDAIPFILVISASEIKNINNAYSTRSCPSSPNRSSWNLTYSFKSMLFIRVLPLE